LSADDGVVGVTPIFSPLPHTPRCAAVYFYLYMLRPQHAASALVRASLFARDAPRLPGLEAFLDLNV
jgi:hypothetical protein